MRLLIVSQYFWPEYIRVNDLVAALEQRGHEVTVLTGVPNYPGGTVFEEFRREPGRFSRFGDARVVRVPLVPRAKGPVRLALNYLSYMVTASTLGVWRLRGRQFDAIIAYQVSPVTIGIPAILLGRLKGIPVLHWTLDLWPESLQAVGVVRSRAGLALVGLMVSAIYRGSALVLGQSPGFAANVERYAGSRERFRYLPQWSEALFEGDGDAVAPAPEVAPFADTFNILFAGNMGESQDFPAILDAAERLKHRADIRWLIVGDGRASSWVADEVARRGLGTAVRLLGRHPIERMPSFYAGADVLFVALKADPVFALTIPGKVQSYLAAGRPVLAMLDGEGARVITEAGAGLTCAAGDSAGLAAQVERLAAMSREEREAMGARGLAYSRREFDRETLLTRLEGWLAEAIDARATAEGR